MASSPPTEFVYRRVGGLIREARLNQGLTQAELSSAVGLTRTSIVNIEQGRQKILLHTLFDFAGALGVEPVSLLPRIDEARRGDIAIPEDLSEGTRDFIMTALRQPQSRKLK